MSNTNTILKRGSRRNVLETLTSPTMPTGLYQIFTPALKTLGSTAEKFTSAIRINPANQYISGLSGVKYDMSNDTGSYMNIGPSVATYSDGYFTTNGEALPNFATQFTVGSAAYGFNWGYDEIFNYYCYGGGTLYFSGLASGTYDFVYWGIGPNYTAAPHYTAFTMTGVTKTTVYNGYVNGVYVENKDHVIFRNLKSNGQSIITGTFTQGAGASYGPMNAFQIIKTSNTI